MMTLIDGSTLNALCERGLAVLADSAAKGVIVLALAWMIALILRRSSAAARHLIWALALVGLLLLPVLSVSLPKWQIPVLPGTTMPAKAKENAIALPQAPVVQPTEVRQVTKATQETQAAGDPSKNPPSNSGNDTGGAISPPVNDIAADYAAASPSTALPLGFWVIAAWFAVAAVLLIPLAAGIVFVKRLVRRSEPLGHAPWPELLRALSEQLGLRRRVRVLRMSASMMPMAVGVAHPTILLPAEAEEWTSEKRHAVLLHELAHIRRWDCAAHILTRLACVIHWFNPLAWLALKKLQNERERACDDLVLTAGARPAAYADQLLDIARTMHASAITSTAAIPMARKSQLEGRLLAILDATRNRRVIRWGAMIAGVVLLLAITVPLGMLKFGEARVFAKMTPQQRADFEVWYTQKVNIPPEALQLPSFDPQTIQAVQEFYRQASIHKASMDDERWSSLDANAKDSIPDDSIAQSRVQLRIIEPLLAAFNSVVRRPDYTIGVWQAALDPRTGEAHQLKYISLIRFAARVTYIDSMVKLKDQRQEEAISAADALMSCAHIEPYSTMLEKMITMSILSKGIAAYGNIANQATDLSVRQMMHDNLAKHRARFQFNPAAAIDPLTLDHIAMSSDARRVGLSPDFQNKTGFEIGLETTRIQTAYLKQILPNLDQENRKKIENEIELLGGKQARAQKLLDQNPTGLRRYFLQWVEPIVAATLYSIASPVFEKSREKAMEVLAQYDQLLQSLGTGMPRAIQPPIPDTAPSMDTDLGNAQSSLLAQAKPVRKTTLEAGIVYRFLKRQSLRDLPFSLDPSEEKDARDCIRMARGISSSSSDSDSTRQQLEEILKRRPGYFYAEYLLGAWYRGKGDPKISAQWFRQSYDHAPVIVIQRFLFSDGRPLSTRFLNSFGLECNRVQKGYQDPSLELYYPQPQIDEQGAIYLPAYNTVFRANDMASPEGYATDYPRLGCFKCRGKVGLLPTAQVRPNSDNSNQPSRQGGDSSGDTGAYEKAQKSKGMKIKVGPNTFVVRHVFRLDRDGMQFHNDGMGAAQRFAEISWIGPEPLPYKDQAPWLDMAAVYFGIDPETPNSQLKYDIIEMRVFDHATKKIISPDGGRPAVGWKMRDNGIVELYSAGALLPESVDLWFRANSFANANDRVLLRPKSGTSFDFAEGKLTIREVRDGEWSCTSREGKIEWNKVLGARPGCTIVLDWSGNWTEGQYQICAADNFWNRSFPDVPHYLDFKHSKNATEIIQIPMSLDKVTWFELRPFGGRHTFYFDGIQLPKIGNAPLAAPPTVTFDVNGKEIDHQVKAIGPVSIDLMASKGTRHSGTDRQIPPSGILDPGWYAKRIDPTDDRDHATSIHLMLQGLSTNGMSADILDKNGRELDANNRQETVYNGQSYMTLNYVLKSTPLESVDKVVVHLGENQNRKQTANESLAASKPANSIDLIETNITAQTGQWTWRVNSEGQQITFKNTAGDLGAVGGPGPWILKLEVRLDGGKGVMTTHLAKERFFAFNEGGVTHRDSFTTGANRVNEIVTGILERPMTFYDEAFQVYAIDMTRIKNAETIKPDYLLEVRSDKTEEPMSGRKAANSSDEKLTATLDTLRGCAVAMNAHLIDTNSYPKTLDQMTTPVAFLSGLPEDPYATSGSLKTIHWKPDAKPAPLLYSIGPDRIDQGGEIAYDPTNGTTSSGDIIRALKPAKAQSYEEAHGAELGREIQQDAPIEDLIKALESDNINQWSRGADFLATRKDKAKPAVPALVKALDHPQKRESALYALREMGPAASDAVPALIRGIGEWTEHSAARSGAAVALANIGEAAVPALQKAADSTNTVVSIWAHAALARNEVEPPKPAYDPTNGTLSDSGVYRVSPPDADTFVDEISWKSIYSPNLKELGKYLGSNDRTHAPEALEAVKMLGPVATPLVPLLHRMLQARNPGVQRRDLVEALERIGPAASEALPEIAKSLDAKDPLLRVEAIRAVAAIDGPKAREAIPQLIKALQANDTQTSNAFLAQHQPWIRAEAAKALGTMGKGASEALPQLIKTLDNPDETARGNAVEAIGKIDPANPRALTALIKAMKDPSFKVSPNAIMLLVKVGPINIDVIRAFIRAVRENAGRFGGMYTGPSCDIVPASGGFFVQFGPEQRYAVPDLAELARDPHPGVQRLAFQALSDIGGVPADLLPMLIDCMQNDSSRSWAPAILKKLGPKAAPIAPALIKILRDGKPEQKSGAMEVLGAIGMPAAHEAIPILTQMAQENAETADQFNVCETLLKLDPASSVALDGLEKVLADPKTIFWEVLGIHTLLYSHGRNPQVHLQALEAALNGKDPVLSANAPRMILEVCKQPEIRKLALLKIFQLMQSPDSQIKGQAASGFTNVIPEDQASVPGLVAQLLEIVNQPLKTEGNVTRHGLREAVEGLGKLGPAALPSLAKLQQDDDWLIRKKAREAIKRIGG